MIPHILSLSLFFSDPCRTLTRPRRYMNITSNGVIVSGGSTNAGQTNEMLFIDLDKKQIYQLRANEIFPPPRTMHTAVNYGISMFGLLIAAICVLLPTRYFRPSVLSPCISYGIPNKTLPLFARKCHLLFLVTGVIQSPLVSPHIHPFFSITHTRPCCPLHPHRHLCVWRHGRHRHHSGRFLGRQARTERAIDRGRRTHVECGAGQFRCAAAKANRYLYFSR
jgi:hypothetical protein